MSWNDAASLAYVSLRARQLERGIDSEAGRGHWTDLGTNEPSDMRNCSCSGCRPALIASVSVHSGRTGHPARWRSVQVSVSCRSLSGRTSKSARPGETHRTRSCSTPRRTCGCVLLKPRQSCYVGRMDARSDHVEPGDDFRSLVQTVEVAPDLGEHVLEDLLPVHTRYHSELTGSTRAERRRRTT